MAEREFDLKLSDGTIVKWFGTSGENAAKRFVDCNSNKIVVAWRESRVDLVVGIPKIKE